MQIIHIMRTYHSFLPDNRHPVLHSIHSVWDLSEVVFAQSFLAHGEGAVVCPSHTEIITGTRKEEIHMWMIELKVNKKIQWKNIYSSLSYKNHVLCSSLVSVSLHSSRSKREGQIDKHSHMSLKSLKRSCSTYLASRSMRYPGVLGSGLSGGPMT